MSAVAEVDRAHGHDTFDLDDEASYQRWRAVKLATRARQVDELVVDVADPAALSGAERAALLQRCARWNMAIYRSAKASADKTLVHALGAQLGLRRLDANWLSEEDGISSITVSDARDERGGFIPYTERPIKWH
ncbi:MAG TPA: hypothetical protein VLJ62_27575, partial [Burkholderiaceae bacterium]|nr:hypothetical protein [Burkholderiaceae bacterium]